MSKSGKRFIAVLLILLTIFCATFAGCSESPDKYTVEEHIERISERIEERYFGEDTKFTGYAVYPLYNAEDKVEYFLVEFEPSGFAVVLLNNNRNIFRRAMYKCNDRYLRDVWQRYRIYNFDQEIVSDQEEQWKPKDKDYNLNRKYEVDQDGNFIEYKRSPFFVANVLMQKMFFLDVYGGYVPAIKKNDKFINLISMEEFEYKGDMKFYKNLGASYVYDNIPLISVAFLAEPYDNL